MAFFVVVHHKRDADQPWTNEWHDDDRLRSITTTADIAARCYRARRDGERVYVHRCAWQGGPPLICCSVEVEKEAYGEGIGWVTFRDPRSIGVPPSYQPARGKNSYDADAPPSQD